MEEMLFWRDGIVCCQPICDARGIRRKTRSDRAMEPRVGTISALKHNGVRRFLLLPMTLMMTLPLGARKQLSVLAPRCTLTSPPKMLVVRAHRRHLHAASDTCVRL